MSTKQKTYSNEFKEEAVKRVMSGIPASQVARELDINVNDINPGYSLLKRATYYASRMISSQRGRDFQGDEYDQIRKVYTIWICMNAPKETGNSINRYRVTEEHLHGRYHADETQYNLINIVMLYLGNRKTQDKLMEMLRIIFKEEAPASVKKKQLEENYDIHLTEDETKELNNMCNLSEGVYNNGFHNGFQDGFHNGYNSKAKESLQNLIKNTGWTLKKAMQMLGIPSEEEPQYKKLLKQTDKEK